ncbi:MAG: glycosyltransferase family 4 protein [Bryobacteraceae bacterium]
MNILFLDQFSTVGGGQRSLLELLPIVVKRGWNVRVAVPGEGVYSRDLKASDLPVEFISCGVYTSGRKNVCDIARYAWKTPQITKRLFEIVTARRIDLLYVNGPRLLPAAALVARQRSIPLLFHTHHRISQEAGVRLAGESLRWARAEVLACCSFAAEPLQPYLRTDKVRIVYNGVPEMRCRRRRSDTSTRCIGVIGRIEPEKGQIQFVGAARMLREQFPDCQFLVVGAPLFSSPRYSEKVMKAARDLPFRFAGWQDDISSVFANLDLLVVPSTPADSTPRVIVEAFSAGVPVVAFAAGGIPEIVKDGQTGFLASDFTAEALAARIRSVLDMRPGTLQAIVQEAKATWRERYTLSRFQEDVADAIGHVCSRMSVQSSAAATIARTAAVARTVE